MRVHSDATGSVQLRRWADSLRCAVLQRSRRLRTLVVLCTGAGIASPIPRKPCPSRNSISRRAGITNCAAAIAIGTALLQTCLPLLQLGLRLFQTDPALLQTEPRLSHSRDRYYKTACGNHILACGKDISRLEMMIPSDRKVIRRRGKIIPPAFQYFPLGNALRTPVDAGAPFRAPRGS